MKRLLLILVAGLALVTNLAFADETATSSMTVTVAAEASFETVSTTPLSTTGTIFNAYTGDTTFTYKIRTTPTTGAGSIKLQVTTDFSGAGAPDADSGLTYTCAVGASGTACSGSVAASSTAQTTVGTFGPDAHSGDSGDSGTVSWSLVNKPSYVTGSYSAVVTYTIAAT